VKRQLLFGLMALGLFLFCTSAVSAQEEPGWWGVVIADGPTQAQIDCTDILLRPYRPFHVYGNTVRRMYYRGNPLPTWHDIENSVHALMEGPTPWPLQ
jgi:hypothetical protein